MYCDFCGRNLFYKGKYCRYCGRQVQEYFSDTQPLPMMAEVLSRYPKGQDNASLPWYKLKFKTTATEQQKKWWRIAQRVLAIVIMVLLVYVVVTFKTIKEYQILMGVLGSGLVSYLWWKS